MAFWNKLFGNNKQKESEKQEDKKQEDKKNEYDLQWIASEENPWKVQLLDLRPISQHMLSSSKDPNMAANAISYAQEDGLVFVGNTPESQKEISSSLTFPIDGRLEQGVLFNPSEMEHKWAIYFHQNQLIFVRSWFREVYVVAETIQENNTLIVTRIRGQFSGDDESPEFTESVLKCLIHSHVLNEIVPAPIPEHLQDETDTAGIWAFSLFGNMAHFGHFEASIHYETTSKLRSHSLLHIAVAQGDLQTIKNQLEQGANIHALAGDGLSTLQWCLGDSTEVLEYLLKAGANPNITSVEGATPIMNAVQSHNMGHLKVLMAHEAKVNAQDHRGFTALHRAAEMGHLDMVEFLLEHGAEPNIQAEGHTPLSLAEIREHKDIIAMLTS